MIQEVIPPGLYNMHLSITPKHTVCTPTISYSFYSTVLHTHWQPLYSSFPYSFVLSVMHSRVHPTSQGSDQHYDLLLTRCCDELKCPLTDNDQWHPATAYIATEAKLRFSNGVCLANSTRTCYQCGIMCTHSRKMHENWLIAILTSAVEATTCTKCQIPNH